MWSTVIGGRIFAYMDRSRIVVKSYFETLECITVLVWTNRVSFSRRAHDGYNSILCGVD